MMQTVSVGDETARAACSCCVTFVTLANRYGITTHCRCGASYHPTSDLAPTVSLRIERGYCHEAQRVTEYAIATVTHVRRRRIPRTRVAETDLRTLARWLPQILGRAQNPVQTSSRSDHALAGRGELVDNASREFSVAVASFERLRALARTGGAAAALLWAAYVQTNPDKCDSNIVTCLKCRQPVVAGQPCSKCRTVAMEGRQLTDDVADNVIRGVAPRILRDDWQKRAARPTRGQYRAAQWRAIQTRAALSPRPTERKLAAEWGASQLAPLYLGIAPCPEDIGRAFALGFAEHSDRSEWAGMTSSHVAVAVMRAWALDVLARAAESYGEVRA